jgi:hypothetical protein
MLLELGCVEEEKGAVVLSDASEAARATDAMKSEPRDLKGLIPLPFV